MLKAFRILKSSRAVALCREGVTVNLKPSACPLQTHTPTPDLGPQNGGDSPDRALFTTTGVVNEPSIAGMGGEQTLNAWHAEAALMVPLARLSRV